MRFSVLMVLCAGVLGGCSSAPKYACGLPDGVGCKSVSEVYAGAKNSTLPRSKVERTTATADTGRGINAFSQSRPVVATVKPGEAILTTPQYVRMWVSRWEDGDGDMHDETFIYLRLNNGHWTLKK